MYEARQMLAFLQFDLGLKVFLVPEVDAGAEEVLGDGLVDLLQLVHYYLQLAPLQLEQALCEFLELVDVFGGKRRGEVGQLPL